MIAFVGIDRLPIYLADCNGRTAFQIQYAKGLAKQRNFDFFGINPMSNKRQRLACTFTFITKDGRMHIHRIGIEKVIATRIAA